MVNTSSLKYFETLSRPLSYAIHLPDLCTITP
jgi:hypothetical protein